MAISKLDDSLFANVDLDIYSKTDYGLLLMHWVIRNRNVGWQGAQNVRSPPRGKLGTTKNTLIDHSQVLQAD